MKLNLKSGESLRIKADSDVSFSVYIEHGLIHLTAQPKYQKTRVYVADRRAAIEITEKPQ